MPEAIKPIAVMQTIETDWYPKEIEIMFSNCEYGVRFEKGKPIAQGFCIPRREYTISEMSGDEIKQNKRANKFLEENEDKYVTREQTSKNNLYENISNLALRDQLPDELKEPTKIGNQRRIIK
jgi:hypothetical protein